MEFEVDRMEPLFATEADFKEFEERHAKHQVPVKDLATYQGKAFLGIDAGSTTTKAALVAKTVLYYILSIIITMEIRLVQRFLQLKTFTANCRKAWKLSTPALPDMAKR